jgi:hypothetical protein
MCYADKAYGAVGASVPWTEYEAETGTLGDGASIVSMVLPLSNPSNTEPTREASGAAYVQLTGTGQSVTWTNNSGQSVTFLNIRIQIPDAPTGGGITSTLDLYVNGTLRQAINVNSQQTYTYGGSNTDKNPADGGPTHVWDEYRFFVTGAAIAPGSTITLQKDAANTASFYNIDLIDLETPPAALTQPANSLSVTSYGAVANNASVDNTTAIANCATAAQSAGKSVWIPAGTFYMGHSTDSGIVPTNITVSGAGMWYTTLYYNPTNPLSGGNVVGGTSYTLENLAIDSNAVSAGCASATGISGSNWMINSIWVEHMSLAVWAAGNTGTIENIRVNGTWSDGINLNNFAGASTTGSNLTATNNFIRGTGDDAIAVNGTDATGETPMNNIQITNNTIVETAGRIVVYAGRNILIQNNLAHDVIGNDGIQVGYFQQTGSVLNVLVQGNTLLRCGNSSTPAMLLGTEYTSFDDNGTEQSYSDADFTVIGNTISNPYDGGVDIAVCSDLDFENNVISSPQLYGMQIDGDAVGNGVIDNNVLGGLPTGQSEFISGPNTFTVQTSSTPLDVATEASSYNNESGIGTQSCSEGGLNVDNITNGSYTEYNNINLNGMTSFAARVASATSGGNIAIYLDSTSGTLIGTCAVPATNNWQTWTTVTCNLSGATGYHNVYLVYTGGSGYLFNVEWFAFTGKLNVTEASSYNNESGIGTQSCSEGGLNVDNITNGSYTEYNNVNLNGVASFAARVASLSGGSTLSIYLDSPTGTLIGTCAVPSTGGWQNWTTVNCTLGGASSYGASGYHNVYLVYTSGMNIQWFAFQGIINGIEGSSYNNENNLGLENCSEGGLDVADISNGSYSEYNNVNLNDMTSFSARVASAGSGGNIEICLDSPTGTIIGTATVPITGGWQTWTTVGCNLSGATGFHNVYLVYTGGGGNLFNVEWFAFQGSNGNTAGASYNSLSAGAMHLETCAEGGQDLANIDNGNYAVYNSVNLTGMTGFEARVASAGAGGSIAIHLDSATGTVVGTATVPVTGGWQTWTNVNCSLSSNATGFHNLYLTFTGGGGALFNLQWFALQGTLPPVFPAAIYSAISGGCYATGGEPGWGDIAGITNGCYTEYNNINLNGATSFQARVSDGGPTNQYPGEGGNINIHLDSPTGTLIGTCPVTSTGSWSTFTTVTCNVSGASGVHNVYMVFTGPSGWLFNLEWFNF